MTGFKKRFSNPFKRQAFRNPKKLKITKWSQFVLETVDNYTKILAEISKQQKISSALKSN